jgi:hypothetical protein
MQKTPLKKNFWPSEANDLDLKVPMAWQVRYALVLPIIPNKKPLQHHLWEQMVNWKAKINGHN